MSAIANIFANTFEQLCPVGPRLTPSQAPVLTPTIAPLGRERLIPVRNVSGREVVVFGGATGREYRFAPGESREVPLADARLLVVGEEFAFSGGR